MDETLEKKLRALKLKLMMAEKELQASSGKWKLGALLGAGHTSAMNREVDKLKERLESKIERLNSEIALLSGTPIAPKVKAEPLRSAVEKKTQVQNTEAAKKSKPTTKSMSKKAVEPAAKKAQKAAETAKKSATKKTAKTTDKK